jgi:hypothetical protein
MNREKTRKTAIRIASFENEILTRNIPKMVEEYFPLYRYSPSPYEMHKQTTNFIHLSLDSYKSAQSWSVW